MAIAMTTFGNTLSDLQALTNADKGLDYQRANAQDAINQQRLEAFLRLRGQQLQTEAQKNRDAADRAQRMAELIQQNSQFGTSEGNRMKIAELDAQTRRDVANATAGKSAAFAELQALNAEQAQAINLGKQMSAARIAALAEKKKIKDAQGYTDFFEPNISFFNRRVNPRWTELNETIAKLDAEAAKLGFAPGTDGGYVIGDTAPPVVVPVTPQAVAPIPPMIPVTPPAPSSTGSAYMGMGGMLPRSSVEPVLPFAGGTFRGVGAGSSWADPVVPVVPPSTNRTIRVDTNNQLFYVP